MNLLKASLTFLSLFLFATSTFAQGKVKSLFIPPSNSVEESIEKELRDHNSVDYIVDFLNEKFYVLNDITFIIGEGDDPLFDSEKNEILIPYGFVKEIKERFVKEKYSQIGVNLIDTTMEPLIHTLLHEFAHALINMYKLPIVGKEEDAADSMATILLIDFFDDGQEMAITAGDLFGFESDNNDEFEEEDFMDEHSLDLQRFYSTMCYVYGSDPEKYNALKENIGFSQDRAELCIEEYESVSNSWMKLLKPYMKKNNDE